MADQNSLESPSEKMSPSEDINVRPNPFQGDVRTVGAVFLKFKKIVFIIFSFFV